MNKKMFISKKIGAVVVTVVMLFNIIMGTAWKSLNLVAEDTETTFSADFTEMEALVPDTKFDTNGCYYLPKDDNPELTEWLVSRFAFYGKQENHTYVELTYPGQPSVEWDSEKAWSNFTRWAIPQNGGLRNQIYGSNGEMMRKHLSLTLKTAEGELAILKNFEARVVFRKPVHSGVTNQIGAVYISFRETAPGNLAFNSSGTLSAGTDAVIVGNGTSADRTYGGDDGITPGNVRTFADNKNMSRHFPTNLNNTDDYELYVRLVDTSLTWKVTCVSDGSTIDSGETTIVDADAGYLSVGTRMRELISIHVTELDNLGNAVDFGTCTSQQVKTFDANFTELEALVQDSAFQSGMYYFQETDTQLAGWLESRFAFYGKQENHTYVELTYPGQPSVEWDGEKNWSNFTRWTIAQDGGLRNQLFGSNGEMMRKHLSVTLKTAEGELAVLKNFEARVVFKKPVHSGVANPIGAVYLSFRETKPGNLAFNASGTLAAGTDAVIVGNGTSADRAYGGDDGITPGNVRTFADNKNMSHHFPTQLNNTDSYELFVRLVDTSLTWKVVCVSDGSIVDSGVTTITDADAGYLSVGARNRELISIDVTELDADGNVVDFGTCTLQQQQQLKTFDVDFTELEALVLDSAFQSGIYYFTETDNQLTEWLESRFAFYGKQENHAYVELTYPGQPSVEWDGEKSWSNFTRWTIAQDGGLRNQLFGFNGEMMRKHLSLTLKTDQGDLALLKNFEARVVFRKPVHSGVANPIGAVYLSFRETEPGNLAFNSSGTVAAGTDAVIVGNGTTADRALGGDDGITPGNVRTFGDNRNMSHHFPTNLNNTDDYELFVRVVGTTLTWKVTCVTDGTTVDEGESTTIDADAGYLSVGARNREFLSITVTELNSDGQPIDFNGTNQGVDCPWDTEVDSFSQKMNATESALDAVYDFYYTDSNGTKKETMGAHWKRQANSILVRQNDLDGSATDKLAMLHFHGKSGNEQFANVDARFHIAVDAEQQGTFWVTARQSNAANRGKLTATAGGNDFLTDQVAVGFSDSGDITISDGKNASFTISGSSTGTLSGTCVLRVRLFGDKLEVYVNGVRKYSKNLQDMSTAAGALSFGCSGAAFGISRVDITRLDENGVPVDMETEYASVQNPDRIWLRTGSDYETDLLPQLPQKVTVTKKDNTPEDMAVSWDLSGINLSVEGEYHMTGYLQNTNGIRASVVVLVGKHDREITKIYTFDDISQLDDFESWYLPATNVTNQPAIHTEGTADDNWIIRDGKLTYRQNSMYLDGAALKEGKEINGVFYKDEVAWNAYTGNFGIAVLKVPYENFILEVDYQSNYFWNIVGFGAEDYTDAKSVFSSQKAGGYSFRVERQDGYGDAKLWGYSEEKGVCDILQSMQMPYTWNATDTHHYRIIVSDGIARLYLDDSTTPLEVELPGTYDGGYIYLAHNTGGGFDNLRITDLDSKDIYITEIMTPSQGTIEIDRAAGESLPPCSGDLLVADRDGFEYSIPYDLLNDTYRSYIPGEHVFEAKFLSLHNIHISANLKYTVTINNLINDDFDADVSRKYYFDHPNDFLDFYSQTSAKNYNGKAGYYSGYDGELVTTDAEQLWTVTDGQATTNYVAERVGYSDMGKLVGTSSLVLKDINLMNFRVEMDYTQGNTFWYSHLLLGVQDPNKFVGNIYWGQGGTFEKPGNYGKQLEYHPEWGGGVWAFLEREGRFNVWGALEGVNTYQMADDFTTDFIKTYDPSIQHHMVIEVKDGIMYMQVDDSDVYEFQLDYEAWGGLVGLAAYGNGSTFDNFQITALDADGNEVSFEDAEYGTADWEKSSYSGWKVPNSEWSFEWGPEYEAK